MLSETMAYCASGACEAHEKMTTFAKQTSKSIEK